MKISPHALGAICWTFVPEESWHCPRENKIQALCLLVGPRWPGLRPQGLAWLGPKNPGFGGGVVEPSLCSRAVRGGGDETKQILSHQESKSLLPRLIPMVGWLHILGTLTDLIRDKWSGAKSSRRLCRLVWQAWLLHCFICLWSSHRSGRARLESHTRPAHSLQRNAAFLVIRFKKNNTVVFKRCRAFGCRWVLFDHTCWDSPAFTSREKPELDYWSGLFHH